MTSLAATPQMGWNSWNAFGCNISAELIANQTMYLHSKGLQKFGYNYVILDDCWQDRNRDKEGNIKADPVRFPNGMKAVGDDIHAYGLKFGIYSSAGSMTCGRRPGSLGFESLDAMAYANWGVDYLKYDNCYNMGVAAKDRYTAMKNALVATGRTVFYSLCNWGNEGVAEWGKTIANSWRTTIDINTSKDGAAVWQSMKSNFLNNMLQADRAGKGGWNDPDLLLVGQGSLTVEEERTHFALWAFSKAPLIISTDLDKISDESLAILKNSQMLAINQDSLGKQAKCVQGCDPTKPSN